VAAIRTVAPGTRACRHRPVLVAILVAIAPAAPRPSGGLALLLGTAVAWRLLEPHASAVLRDVTGARPGGASEEPTCSRPTAGLALLATTLLAAWRRPPSRTDDGTPIAATRVVSAVAVGAVGLGPLLGFVAWRVVTPDDVHGWALGAGLLAGGLGALWFVGDAGFSRLVSRPWLAAALAAAWAIATLALFLLA